MSRQLKPKKYTRYSCRMTSTNFNDKKRGYRSGDEYIWRNEQDRNILQTSENKMKTPPLLYYKDKINNNNRVINVLS